MFKRDRAKKHSGGGARTSRNVLWAAPVRPAHPPPFHRHFSKNITENWWLFFRNCWEEISLKQPAKSALTESAASRLPSIKSPPSTAGAKTLRFEKAWFMEDQARGGGEGGWEIMPECPTATFFSNGSRLNLARYVAYIFFFLPRQCWQDGWRVAACLAIGKTKVAADMVCL